MDGPRMCTIFLSPGELMKKSKPRDGTPKNITMSGKSNLNQGRRNYFNRKELKQGFPSCSSPAGLHKFSLAVLLRICEAAKISEGLSSRNRNVQAIARKQKCEIARHIF